ncbi:MAG: TrkH family potassium uptake protein [Clostridium sp.]|nr:TrkH family potassium uptake protein [Clostridium sp.]MCM1547836.1 TrkH family potassium uptake protein [Ruminococcus sp.]
MNKYLVLHYLSKIVLFGSALFLLPCLVCLYYDEQNEFYTFLLVAAAVALISAPAAIIKPKNSQMYAKEGLVIVAMLWIVYPIAGALPFYISGDIPDFIDAVFESVSGFTTTGSTILTDVEAMSRGMLFWRSFTHWVGGMGVLVLAVAILPSSGDAMHLMRAECPGPQVGKIVPKGKNSALYLYIIYAVLTLLTVIFLMFGGMPFFDSVCHAMGTAGTGGFSIKNAGISYYDSAYIDGVLTVGMILFGVNFSMYYFAVTKRFSNILKNSELKTYLSIMAAATVFIMINTAPIYGSVTKCFRYAVFQVSSVMTSTGYSTADYSQWPEFSQTVLLMIMFVGACAGSTGGGLKVERIIIMFKSAVKSIRKTLNPKSVYVLKGEDKSMDVATVHGVQTYFIIYIALLLLSVLFISVDNADFATSFSSVVTCINNIGPGLNRVGPTENFGFYSEFSKIILSIDMLLGRLECLPLIILFSPSVWRKRF